MENLHLWLDSLASVVQADYSGVSDNSEKSYFSLPVTYLSSLFKAYIQVV
jgi:hypothetical protein